MKIMKERIIYKNKKGDKIFIEYLYDSKKYHILTNVSENAWRFDPAESWMPFYITREGNEIVAVDTDGLNFPICKGSIIDNLKIKGIIETNAFNKDDKYEMILLTECLTNKTE